MPENLKIISTSHIAQESVDEIKQAFDEFEPDCVAVELDVKRLNALASNQEAKYPLTLIRHVGLLGYLFAVVGGYLQKKLGSIVGMRPGQEMFTAVEEAGKRDLDIFLVDQDVEVTLRKLSSEVPFSEKMGLFFELVKGFFSDKQVDVDIDLTKVPEKELIDKLTEELKTKFPHIYKVLVEDRNEVMAAGIKELLEEDRKVLLVVGAGHTQGLLELLD